MARLDTFTGQIPGQLELPHEVVAQFRLPGHWQGKTWQLDFGHTVTLQPTRHADGSGAPKPPKVHWHDWMREQVKPWRRGPDRDLAWLLARHKNTDGFEYESAPSDAGRTQLATLTEGSPS